MKITKMGEYGLLGLIHMVNHDKKIVLVKEVSEELGLPQKFMAKIFQKMAKKGILASFKGKKGGFSLNLPPEEITLLSVIKAIQGPPFIMWCSAEDAECERPGKCTLKSVFRHAQGLLDDYFNNITLKELTSGEDF